MSLWSRISETVQRLPTGMTALFESLTKSNTPPEKSVAFTIGMIALSAKMARADGHVSDSEVLAFGEVFKVPEKDASAVKRVFDLAKQDVAGYETYAEQVARLFDKGSETLENVLDGLFHIAKADGAVHVEEIDYLERISEIFGFTRADYLRVRSRHVAVPDDPYEVLGLPHDATPDMVKQHYRKLARDMHPDRQIAAGMPEELVKIATDRLARINAAYDEITRGKGS